MNLELGPSPTLRLLGLAAHGAALALLWPLPLPGDLTLLLGAVILHSLSRTDAAAAATVRLCWEADGRWRLPDGRAARLHRATFVSPRLVVLNLLPLIGAAPHAWAVPADRLDARRFRHLRARLHLDGPALVRHDDAPA